MTKYVGKDMYYHIAWHMFKIVPTFIALEHAFWHVWCPAENAEVRRGEHARQEEKDREGRKTTDGKSGDPWQVEKKRCIKMNKRIKRINKRIKKDLEKIEKRRNVTLCWSHRDSALFALRARKEPTCTISDWSYHVPSLWSHHFECSLMVHLSKAMWTQRTQNTLHFFRLLHPGFALVLLLGRNHKLELVVVASIWKKQKPSDSNFQTELEKIRGNRLEVSTEEQREPIEGVPIRSSKMWKVEGKNEQLSKELKLVKCQVFRVFLSSLMFIIAVNFKTSEVISNRPFDGHDLSNYEQLQNVILWFYVIILW